VTHSFTKRLHPGPINFDFDMGSPPWQATPIYSKSRFRLPLTLSSLDGEDIMTA
jgi:hypothetical protein